MSGPRTVGIRGLRRTGQFHGTGIRLLDAPISNWMASAWWHRPTSSLPISLFTTKWTVPPEPKTKEDQIIFLFNGLEDEATSVILQPVLQWGRDTLDGVSTADGWYICCWYVFNNNMSQAVSPKAVRVEPGTLLTGGIDLISRPTPANPSYKYNCVFYESPPDPNDPTVGSVIDGTWLTIPNSQTPAVIPELTWCVQTLEAYLPPDASGHRPPGILKTCGDYPNSKSTRMHSISIFVQHPDRMSQVTPVVWSPQPNPDASCGQNAVPNSDGSEVDLVYGGP
jgi:hypothetical protein